MVDLRMHWAISRIEMKAPQAYERRLLLAGVVLLAFLLVLSLSLQTSRQSLNQRQGSGNLASMLTVSGSADIHKTSGCTITFLGGLQQFTRPGELAFVVGQDSTSNLCVRYTPAISGKLANEAVVDVGNFTRLPDGGGSFSLIPTSHVTIEVNLLPSSDNNKSDMVDFQIRTSANSTGFYFLALPRICPAIPLAVGQNSTKLTESDFPGMGPIPCPNFGSLATIEGSSEASYTYISY